MAVTPMKMVTIVGPLHEFDSVVRSCIINREFHPESAATIMRKVKFLHPFDQTNPYAELLRRAETLSDHVCIGLDFHDFNVLHLDSDMAGRYFNNLEKRMRALYDERETLQKKVVENEQIAIQLEHLGQLDVHLEDFFSVRYVKFRFGRMPRDIYNDFLPHLQERKDVLFYTTSIEKEYVYGMYLTPGITQGRIDSLFVSLQFERIRISGEVHGTTQEAVEETKEESQAADIRLAEIEEELKALRSAECDEFHKYYSYVRYMNDSFNLRLYAAHTEESFYLLGWVPGDQHEKFVNDLEAYPTSNLVVVSENAESIADYKPPIKLKNSAVFRPFESFVAMYGLPAYNELDPTPFMAFTYSFIFGIMFGDIGQGAVLALAGLLMWKWKKMSLGPVLCYAGVSAALFGVLYGSVFGIELEYAFNFKVLVGDGTNQILKFGLYLGVILLSLCIAANIWNGIRQKSPVKMFFGQNGLAGLIFYLALVAFFLPIIGFGEPLLSFGLFFTIVAVPLVVIFLREPLSRLAKRSKDGQKISVGGFVVENLFELLEIVLSYLTNTLSFLRIGAYAISHASVMHAIFTLANNDNVAIIVLGNIIVLSLEGLLVGIQVLRLEFYEFFSRFYSGSGKQYKPVQIDYRTRKE